jgi:protein-S-isoprenylcysteine O-methyltransferase Ste14
MHIAEIDAAVQSNPRTRGLLILIARLTAKRTLNVVVVSKPRQTFFTFPYIVPLCFRTEEPPQTAFGDTMRFMSKLYVKAIKSAVFGIIAFAALIFLPSGTLNYWQGWAFLTTFVFSTLIITVYLARHDPKLLERRISAGPQAEKEPAQKVIATLIIFLFAAILVFSALDWRFQWSPVAPWVSIAGDALIFLSYLFFIWVFWENSYGASTIQIAEDQKVISTGPYAIVRHPMYAGALVMLAGIPLALGSWWGLFFFFLALPILIWRLLDEERFLHKYLPGYTEYTQKVRYRLIPLVW